MEKRINTKLLKQKEQETIKQWFDRTYHYRGYGYLRPLAAYEVFLSILHTIKGKALLDVACGGGLMLKSAVNNGLMAYGIDISEEAISMSRKLVPGANIILANAEKIPFPEEKFDYLTCLGSLERFIDLNQALEEMKRVSKKTAKFCFMVRNANTLRWKIFREYLGIINHKAHMSARSLEEWKAVFVNNGFNIINIYPDQWPLQQSKRFFTFWRKPDYHQICSTIRPLKFSNELIFLLEKKHAQIG